jgi:hypothetical protein
MYRSQDVLDHIARAEKVISGWEALGGPGGPKSGSLKMISDEMVYLNRIMEEWPVENDPVEDLVRRYHAMWMMLLE